MPGCSGYLGVVGVAVGVVGVRVGVGMERAWGMHGVRRSWECVGMHPCLQFSFQLQHLYIRKEGSQSVSQSVSKQGSKFNSASNCNTWLCAFKSCRCSNLLAVGAGNS